MPQIYFNQADLKLRIEEIRRIKEVLTVEEDVLILQFSQLNGKENCVVDLKGRLLCENPKYPSTYSIVKAQQDNRGEKAKRAYKAHGVEIAGKTA
jgi:hypothetical protein